jgi:DNA invertase Pin-like site-specific DNA recombinase
MTNARQSKAPPAAPVRCAIYTRKSTEEGLDWDFTSLDAQREAAEAYIHSQAHAGWICLPQRYDDGGFTGSNLDRPALQRLLVDIQAGQVDCVLTHRVDRLSRSLLDFARLMDTFEQHQVAFVSVTQHFHSGTSMGRLVLNVLLSFAQFERELIAERTRDKVAAARRKGKWTGGLPCLGYDVEAHSRKLVVNAEEVLRVRAIFALYLEHRGLLPVVEELRCRGWHNKRCLTSKGTVRGGRPFTKGSLYELLTNVTYSDQHGRTDRHLRLSWAGIRPAAVPACHNGICRRHLPPPAQAGRPLVGRRGFLSAAGLASGRANRRLGPPRRRRGPRPGAPAVRRHHQPGKPPARRLGHGRHRLQRAARRPGVVPEGRPGLRFGPRLPAPREDRRPGQRPNPHGAAR